MVVVEETVVGGAVVEGTVVEATVVWVDDPELLVDVAVVEDPAEVVVEDGVEVVVEDAVVAVDEEVEGNVGPVDCVVEVAVSMD